MLTKTNKDFAVGDTVAILTSVATGHAVLATTMIHGDIERVTDKAVQIKNENGFCWFPKRALVTRQVSEFGTVHCRVAKWFHMDKWHFRMESEPSCIAGSVGF